MHALTIVAHPDDETIWMGGTIIRNASWDWTILSLCRKNDPDRAPRFKRVCEFYNATPIIADLDDEVLEPLSVDEVIEMIKKSLPQTQYDYIFTHGANGEYGHLRHKEVHAAVTKMVEQGMLKCERLFYFSYQNGEMSVPHIPELIIPVPTRSGDIQINLKDSEFSDKRGIVENLYGFQPSSFEVLSCNSGETFVEAR